MATITGTPNDDTLDGTPQADRILGFAGDDLIRGLGGDDELFGMAGDDRLFGGAGDDTLNGGPGNDRLNGGAGDDILIAGVGRDQLAGGAGADTFRMDNLRGGVNTILDFNQGEDVIDVRGLLPDFQEGDTLADFVRVLNRPAGTVLGLDPTGGGGPFVNVALLRGLEDVELTAADLGLSDDGSGPPPSGDFVVASTTAAGTLQDADVPAGQFFMSKDISDDGRFVVFESEAENLVQNEGPNVNVYRKDTVTGDIELVNANANDVPGGGTSGEPAISGTGRFVAFASTATNLVAGDTNNATDVFRKDLQTGEVVRVSANANGVQGNSASGAFGGIAISDDGTKVAFISNATNLVAGDTNGVADLFVKNLTTGAITRANLTGNGQQADLFPLQVALSGDGNTVAFSTEAALLAADTNNAADVYVRNLTTGGLTLAATTPQGAATLAGSTSPSLSDDGRSVAFESAASALVANDTNGVRDVFVKNLQTGQIVRASTSSGGEEQNAAAATMAPAISGDGDVVVFQTDANNLVAADTNNLFDLFAKNLTTGETVRVSVAPNGAELTNASGWPAVNDDGSFAAFETRAPGLVGGGVNVNQVVRAPIDFGEGQPIAASEVLDDTEPVGGLEPGGPSAATPSAVAAAFAPDAGPDLGLEHLQMIAGASAF